MEQNNDIMIRVDGLKKQYRLGQIGGGTLRGDLQSWWARKRGKEDPNTKIGTDQRLVGQKFMALNGVSFTVKKGEAVGIIGSNGAGKSTLLKLLTHVTAPTEGTIDMYGRVASMLEVGTGFHPEMTGRENVYLNGAILGMTKEEIDAKMEDIIEFSEVRDFIDTPVKRYSSGMYVKLAFSVAAHLDSEIMIMDEVLAVGDAKFQEKCLGKMGDEAHGGRTVLYVSHNMDTIRKLCNRVIVLNQGQIIYNGDVEKGISYYLDSTSPTKTIPCRDLDTISRRPEFSNPNVYFQRMELFTNKQGQIFFGEKLHGKLWVSSIQNYSSVTLGIGITSVGDAPVTYATSNSDITLQKGTVQVFDFTLDTSRIVPGLYKLMPVLTIYNSFGSNQFLDAVNEAVSFEILSTPDFNDGHLWDIPYHGYYICPKILYKTYCIHQ